MGQYQSRLFNFIIEQSRRVTETAAIALRRLRVATTWGMETIAFSVDAIVKRVRSSSKAFRQSTTTGGKFVASAVDGSIVRILTLVEPLQTDAEVRSIASSLSSRQLILVGTNNTIIYELSASQHDILQTSIVNVLPEGDRQELAKFIPPQRQFSSQLLQQTQRGILWVRQTTTAIASGKTDRIPNFDAKSAPFLQPVNRILSWVKRTAVAIVPYRSLPDVDETLVKIDRQVATLESEYLPKLETARSQTSQRLEMLLNRGIEYFFSTQKQPSKPPQPDAIWHQNRDRDLNTDPKPPQLPQSQFRVDLQTWVDRVSGQLPNFNSSEIAQQKTEKGTVTTTSKSPDTYLDPNDLDPDWIEIQARSQGYVKHPLERVLEWVDRWLLRIEKWFEKMWSSRKSKL